MKTIDIRQIIEAKGLDFKTVAEQLFPTNQFPRLALNRVIDKKSELDASQISKLALLAGVPIGDLWEASWGATASGKGIHLFSNGEYIAELDTNTWITKIFHKSSMIHESVIHSDGVALSEYFKTLNKIIYAND